LPFFCLLAASLVAKSGLLISSVDWKKKIHFVRSVLVGVGVVLLLASLLESTAFLVKWVGFVAFGVDSVTYYPFDVFSEATNGFSPAFTYVAVVLMVFSIAGSFIAGFFKGVLGWFSKVLSS
jgi:hypothetical protein